ncbi:unnamed protein product, partial [Effrenium voratum]
MPMRPGTTAGRCGSHGGIFRKWASWRGLARQIGHCCWTCRSICLQMFWRPIWGASLEEGGDLVPSGGDGPNAGLPVAAVLPARQAKRGPVAALCHASWPARGLRASGLPARPWQECAMRGIASAFAGVETPRPRSCRLGTAQLAFAFRSSFSPWSFPVPALCSLTIVSAIFPERCYFGTTYGCSNEAHIWVTDGCNAWFRRGGSQGACISDAGQAVKRSEWSYDKVMSRQFVECFLPEVPEPTGRQVMEICAADQDSLDLELVEDDHWRSPRIPVGQHQAMLSVRLPFDAVLEVSTYSAQLRNSGWASAVLQLDGECRAWNVVPFLGFHISFDASTRGRERLLLAKSRMPQFASFMPMAWSGADLRVRSSMVHKEGILGMYDVMDPGSHWGNGSRIWQEAGRLQPGRSLETALRRADGLAALILALRLAVAWMLQEKVPAALLAAVYSAVQLADGPLRDDAVQLLEDTMKEPGDTAGPVQVLHGAFPRLVFSNTFLGRYLHHAATFASSANATT